MRPTQLPNFREGLIRKLTSPVGEVMAVTSKWITEFYGSAPGLTAVETARGDEILALTRADLYYVTEEMGRLVQEESKRIPLPPMGQIQPPAQCGLLWFEGGFALPEAEFQIEGGTPRFLTWRVMGEQVVLTAWGEYHQENCPEDAWSILEVTAIEGRVVRAAMMGIIDGVIDFPEETSARLLACAWIMMQQEVARVAKPAVLPIDLKRARKRHQPDPSDVRVISLRRVHSDTQRAIQEGRYHSRWIVRGHWRKQWYRSRNENSPLYIAPYIKGPDGAPLVMTQKVYKLQH